MLLKISLFINKNKLRCTHQKVTKGFTYRETGKFKQNEFFARRNIRIEHLSDKITPGCESGKSACYTTGSSRCRQSSSGRQVNGNILFPNIN